MTETTMLVTVHFAGLKGPDGTDAPQAVEVPGGATVNDLIARLGFSADAVMLVFVDHDLATLDTPLHDNAVVSMSAFLCGG